MGHKSKFFKKVFETTADSDMRIGENVLIPVMTKETFVPLMGEMWARAKARYKKRYKQKVLKFVEWGNTNFYVDAGFWHPLFKDTYSDGLTTEELFEIWKKEN